MRTDYKKIAEQNTTILTEHLGAFLEGTWTLAHRISNTIDCCLAKILREGKELDSTLILRNMISDLCCALDSLERGGWRTVITSIRTSFEDYCCALQIYADPKAYPLFLKEELDIPKTVSFAKKNRDGYKDFGRMYGMFSSLSHHSRLILLARQVVFIKKDTICLAHLKPIDPNNLKAQANNLLFIAFLLMEGGLLIEEICTDLIETPYFFRTTPNGLERTHDTPESKFIIKLIEKVDQILKTST